MRTIARTTAVALTALVVAGTAPIGSARAAAGDNAVVHWNEIALKTILADSARATPSASSLYVAITQAAVYDAVMAIEGTHQPYALEDDAPRGASVDAAVAAAAHDVLVKYFPAQQAALDSEYAASLASIPDGKAEQQGVKVGKHAAALIITLRKNDGRDAPVPAPADGTEPGQWRRTGAGSVVTPYVAQVKPFLAKSPEQFRPAGPLPVTSEQYAQEYERTRLYGAKTNSLRSPEQDEVARFWTENTVRQYNRALRSFAVERGLSNGGSALLFAMTDIPAADAMITCWNTKYHYLAWRPVTAIRLGDADGNLATVGDPNWEPLSTTALHPEYTSGHACLTGAITRGLQEFLGTTAIDFRITFVNSAGVAEFEHHFPTVADLRGEVEDARVYGGDHWTTGGTDGTALGDALAGWALERNFRAV